MMSTLVRGDITNSDIRGEILPVVILEVILPIVTLGSSNYTKPVNPRRGKILKKRLLLLFYLMAFDISLHLA